jgi:bacteriocin biosynthesis cyclodehydratase domain-containing protein
MTRFLDFKRHLRVETDAAGAAYLFSEHEVIAMRGARIVELAALIDGTRDYAGVLRDRPADMSVTELNGLLAGMVNAGVVTLRSLPAVDGDARAYWDACGVEDPALTDGVALIDLREDGRSAPVRQALEDAGIGTAGTSLSVVLCDDYLDPRLAAIDKDHRAAGRPWLLAKPGGAQVWVGPFFEPGRTACWHCLEHRLWGNRHAEACVQAALGRVGPARRPTPGLPALAAAAAHLISLEVTKWLVGHRYPGQQQVWSLNSFDLRGKQHEVRRRPQCGSCGDPRMMALRTARPVRLRPAPKASSVGGGHRTSTPAEVLDRYRHLVSPITGVVKEITRDNRGPAFVNAYRSGPNVVRARTSLGTLRASLRGENGGKGATAVDAEVGALCEAVERHSGNFHGDELRIRGSLRSLGGGAVHPNDCMLYDVRQYDDRRAWNAEHAAFQHVCEPFDVDAVRDWTPVWSLANGRRRLLPTAMLYYGAPDKTGSVRPDSNGNAAGSSREDAVLQGLLELIERDAVAIWWYNRLPSPGVDLGAFGDPWLTEMTEQYRRIGREMWVLDVTSDLGVPVMVAVSRRVSEPGERVMFGFGAHLDPRTALRRAVSELNQMLPSVLDEDHTDSDPDAERWLRTATVAEHPYLLPTGETRTPADYTYVGRDDIRDDVAELVDMLARQDLDTLVLDQTRPDLGLPVVKVVVPGLRPFWARFAPGRLFDVPVRLGRLAAPTAYADLNPCPMFL